VPGKVVRAITSPWMMLCALASASAGAAAPRPLAEPIEQAKLLDVQPLDGQVFHVQGVDLDETHIWVTSMDRRARRGFLHEFDRATGKLLRRVELTDGVRFHPGGMSISGNSIWIPVAELRPNSTTVVQEIDTSSLTVRRRIAVPDHLGCVAASNAQLVAGNWNSRLLYVFDLARGGPPQVTANPSAIRYQDMKIVDGQLVASGSRTRYAGGVEWLELASLKVVRSLHAGPTGRVYPFSRARPYTAEGMTLSGRDLYLLPEDGRSRLFHFRLEG